MLRQIFAGPGDGRPIGLQLDNLISCHDLAATARSSQFSPEALQAQVSEVLQQMQAILAANAASIDNLGRVTGYMRSAGEHRESVYTCWDAMFPDPADKSAFKILDADLPDGVHFRLDFLAVIGATRTRIDIEGVDARDPAVRIGPWLFTSRLHGTKPPNAEIVEGLEAQARQALANGIQLVELSGGTRADIVEVCGFGRDLGYVEALRRAIDAAFAGQAHRPAFHPVVTFVRPILEVMVEVTAYVK